MIRLILLLLISVFHTSAFATPTNPASAPSIFQEDPTIKPPRVRPITTLNGMRYKLSPSIDLGPRIGQLVEGSLTAGIIFDLLFVDLRLRYGKSNYRNILAGVSTSSTTNINTDELNRPRNDSDPWHYWIAEPGVGVTGRLFPDSLPKWTQTGRVGIGRNSFYDQTNGISFTGWSFSTDAIMSYQPNAFTPTTFDFGVRWTFGSIYAQNLPEIGSAAQLPITLLQFTLGTTFYFK